MAALLLAAPARAAEVPALYREALRLAAEIDATEAYCRLPAQELERKLIAYARTLGTREDELAAMAATAEATREARTQALEERASDCGDLDFLLEAMAASNAFRDAFGTLVEKTLMSE